MYLGLDIGTSGVKAILVDDQDRALAEAAAPLVVDRPRPLWSEQEPESWWRATEQVLDRLAADEPRAMAAVRAIGLSGQMLGVAPLDAADRPLRPALLWNDGRAAAECRVIEERIAGFAEIVGCRAMPGFSAPKILWLARHEPGIVAQARRMLLPKDYVRLRLTGEAVSDRADSSATLLMDTRAGTWHAAIVSACGISVDMLPRLVGSNEISGGIRGALARRWAMSPTVVVAGGGGDNMCGAVGAGVAAPGDAFVSLGTSGVYFVANDRFIPALGGGMHTHRHAIAGLFAQHGCVLSAASALDWLAGLLGIDDIGGFVAAIEAAALPPERAPIFTPYLAGERTPHDDPLATATLSGLSFATDRLQLGRAVLDGVALAIGDCHDALSATGARIERLMLIGGGARSRLWAEIIATVLGRPLLVPASAALGPALGAARLARAAVGGPLIAAASTPITIGPRAEWTAIYRDKRAAYRRHYEALGKKGSS